MKDGSTEMTISECSRLIMPHVAVPPESALFGFDVVAVAVHKLKTWRMS